MVIAGGGLAGLATAVALREVAGLDNVHVFERASQEHWRESGTCTGLRLTPNGLKALEQISPELLARVKSAGFVTSFFGAQMVQIQWSTLRDTLASFLPPDTIDYNASLTALGFKKSTALAVFETTKESGDVVIAADGLHSSARVLLDPALSRVIEDADGFQLRTKIAQATAAEELGRTIFRSVVHDTSKLPELPDDTSMAPLAKVLPSMCVLIYVCMYVCMYVCNLTGRGADKGSDVCVDEALEKVALLGGTFWATCLRLH